MVSNKNYQLGGEAIRKMEDILGDIWRQVALMPFYNNSLEHINSLYKEARDTALACGEDVRRYPKRIRWRTAGLEIIEGERTI